MRRASPEQSVRLNPSQQAAADLGAKAMMPVVGERPFIDYVLDSLARAGIRDVGLVVAPDHNALLEHFRDEFPPALIALGFIVQERALGTADALLAASSWVAESDFLVLNGDNIYPDDALQVLCNAGEPALPVFTRAQLVDSGIAAERVAEFAILDVDANGYLSRIVEKPGTAELLRAGDDALVSMNLWRFDARIFDACRDVAASPRGELELPQAVALAVARGMKIRAIRASGVVLDLSRRSDVAEVSRRLNDIDPRY
jgi:glucose-1-phosphate thymidylyltransferase